MPAISKRKSSKKKLIRIPSPVDKVGLMGLLRAPGQLTNRRVGILIPAMGWIGAVATKLPPLRGWWRDVAYLLAITRKC